MLNFYSPYRETGFDAWKQKLELLQSSEVFIRQAEPKREDGQWIRWIQADCESTTIRSLEDNISTIRQQLVLLAEIDGCPVGFCRALVGRNDADPLFVQLIAVVPSARRQGAGIALLREASKRQPKRNIAMAVLDDNVNAQRLNECFAHSIGGELQRVNVRRYRRSDLGIAQGERHRPWLIERPLKAD